jgi:thymidine phosphorylase
VEIWAPDEVLAARIEARGRESGAAVAARLARRVPLQPPEGVEVIRVTNDSSIQTGIARFILALEQRAAQFRLRRFPVDTGRRHTAFVPRHSSLIETAGFLGAGRIEIDDGGTTIRSEIALTEADAGLAPDELGLSVDAFAEFARPEGTLVTFRRTPSPASRDALRRKIAGGELGEDDYETVVRDIVAGRYPDAEVAGFLVAANRSLSDAEVLALARVRARFARAMTWDEPIVVDKHSMGGIPGSRITLIVVPLVAAHGLLMPKTSSRAITSAAGTADAMETLARVDLTAEEVRATVARARGCIAWNGRLSHSALDDVMNAITRPARSRIGALVRRFDPVQEARGWVDARLARPSLRPRRPHAGRGRGGRTRTPVRICRSGARTDGRGRADGRTATDRARDRARARGAGRHLGT